MRKPLLFPIIAAIFVLIVATLAGFQVWFPKIWRPLLTVDTPPEHADALIVLGGEPLARPLEAARLFNNGVADRIFVTGEGDDIISRRILIRSGVPAEKIVIEKKSTSTYENAVFTKPLLKKAGIRSAIIVTSPFHARRSLAVFQQCLPGIEFSVATARIRWWDTPRGRAQEDFFALVEFGKIPLYFVLHGITPFLKDPALQAPAKAD